MYVMVFQMVDSGLATLDLSKSLKRELSSCIAYIGLCEMSSLICKVVGLFNNVV